MQYPGEKKERKLKGKMLKNKKIIIEYNTYFYPTQTVKRAIADFREVAIFKIKLIGNNRIKVSISDFNESLYYSLAEEFSNYILSLTKNG